MVAVPVGLAVTGSVFFLRELNIMLLGEEQARTLGVDTSRLKLSLLVLAFPAAAQPKPAEAASSAFIARLDAELCLGCETCLDRCQMEALSEDGDRVALDRGGLLPAQKHAAAALVQRLQKHSDALLVGEMGTGKAAPFPEPGSGMTWRASKPAPRP